MGLFGGGNSTENQFTSNTTDTTTFQPVIGASDNQAPTVVVSGGGGDTTANVSITTTDFGALDQATKLSSHALDVAGSVATTAIASNTVVTSGAIDLAGDTVHTVVASNDATVSKVTKLAGDTNATVKQISDDAISAIGNNTRLALEHEDGIITTALNQNAKQNDKLLGLVDSSLSHLGDAFTGGLSFVADQEKNLSNAQIQTIQAASAANRSETALQTQDIQQTLIKLVGILAVGAVVAAYVVKARG